MGKAGVAHSAASGQFAGKKRGFGPVFICRSRTVTIYERQIRRFYPGIDRIPGEIYHVCLPGKCEY